MIFLHRKMRLRCPCQQKKILYAPTHGISTAASHIPSPPSDWRHWSSYRNTAVEYQGEHVPNSHAPNVSVLMVPVEFRCFRRRGCLLLTTTTGCVSETLLSWVKTRQCITLIYNIYITSHWH